MTLFFGLMNIKKNPLPNELLDETKKVFVEHAGFDRLVENKQDYFYCLGFDSGAFNCPAVIDDRSNSNFCLLTGEPLISGNSRYIDLSMMYDEFVSGNIKSHKLARGVYSGVFFNPEHGDLVLLTDKLGIRPVYLYYKNDLLVFSSILNLVNKLSFIDLTIDNLGLSENIAFGYPLDDRTPYKFIKRLRSAEEILISSYEIKSSIYWDWSSFVDKSKSSDVSELVKKAFDVFDEAVRIRIQDETNAIAFLSGGMDSRCVTALVKQHVNNLYTFNFSTPGSQDAYFADLYSQHLQSKHFEYSKDFQAYPNWSQLIHDAWLETKNSITDHPIYPMKAWSGDGGTGAGFVFLNEKMHQFIDNNQLDQIVDEFFCFNNLGLPRRYLDEYFVSEQDIKFSMNSLLGDLVGEYSNKTIYFFLMFNSQRRFRHEHFETLALHKTELVMPFFDSDFISVIAAVPVPEMLYHKFYSKWFELFPVFTRQSPWQTYPGHEKCSLETAVNSTHQWDLKYPKFLKNQETDLCIKMVLGNKELRKYLKIPLAIFALIAHRIGVLDVSQLLGAVKLINKHLRKC